MKIEITKINGIRIKEREDVWDDNNRLIASYLITYDGKRTKI